MGGPHWTGRKGGGEKEEKEGRRIKEAFRGKSIAQRCRSTLTVGLKNANVVFVRVAGSEQEVITDQEAA